MWTATHFPASMRSLSPTTRLKAIEIANQLLAQGELDKQQLIALSIEEARRLARCERVDQTQWTMGARQFA
ncbi:hypothetical protein GCM10027592_55220 [Spirosoma flavus]